MVPKTLLKVALLSAFEAIFSSCALYEFRHFFFFFSIFTLINSFLSNFFSAPSSSPFYHHPLISTLSHHHHPFHHHQYHPPFFTISITFFLLTTYHFSYPSHTYTTQGMAIVAFPYGVLQGGGWILVSILVVGILSCYSGIILIECLYDWGERYAVLNLLEIFCFYFVLILIFFRFLFIFSFIIFLVLLL